MIQLQCLKKNSPETNGCLEVVELINGHDGKTTGVMIMMGKTNIVISRPMNKVYPLELVAENDEIRKENEQRDRPRRQAAIIVDLKLKFGNK